MKKFALVSSLLVLFAAPSWGITITDAGAYYGTDVGSVDTYKNSVKIVGSSDPTAEEAWVNSELSSAGTTTSFTGKDEDVKFYGTDALNTFAFSMAPNTPEYFVIKNATYRALYQNTNELGWGVFNFTDLPDKMNLGKLGDPISHVSRFDSGTTPVPEPSTTLLLGAGLLGFGLYSRKRSKQ
ncbi:hypothetical protein Ping_2777 [Psychromonas ingrahamii 37]|uniref:Ice-binding protein C-terminal domain-containing protein n=1 Tax=Psychromonas ingrahamii (strain DSM 17664 / CCUG 51855 / 37) TaxID=357804 RepID=A1SYB9_PSYIN|nr:PEP-CTERM sorting domain-containing protein [Psychromonas ingrahamii]ABM04484.1 hypothetical protein Ping_2777 [Psychromonas ingrahamii 37]